MRTGRQKGLKTRDKGREGGSKKLFFSLLQRGSLTFFSLSLPKRWRQRNNYPFAFSCFSIKKYANKP
ncbi:hypothetical protein NC653_002784 [Populus alba x Populus x berolinensis]|uniref:Uncharacterized protein n=1 Tax=Populus alba x Populus x berolinensis TaxID=444605 RepID=A0AAD6RQI3_9ROSI|nr:hypothetical protein NC653_002784 [Populus alba x Populus x berolinensis]